MERESRATVFVIMPTSATWHRMLRRTQFTVRQLVGGMVVAAVAFAVLGRAFRSTQFAHALLMGAAFFLSTIVLYAAIASVVTSLTRGRANDRRPAEVSPAPTRDTG